MAGEPYGEAVPSDDAFTARMRFHQSWWRHERLGAPIGTGPGPRSDRELGNCLDDTAADAGLNFLTAAIAAYARSRMADSPGVEPFRCTHNLLSSQPMAFNLFGPLHADPLLAARLMSSFLPFRITEAQVNVEWAPASATHLDDRTSCDAVCHGRTADGRPVLVAIETKLTEPFSRKRYDTDRYREVAHASTVWASPASAELSDPEVNQLWRNQLLVEAIRQQPGADPNLLGISAVVHHPKDTRCPRDIARYRALLADEHSFFDLPLDVIVETWKPIVAATEHEPWLRDFEDRYLRLELSEAAWISHRPSP